LQRPPPGEQNMPIAKPDLAATRQERDKILAAVQDEVTKFLETPNDVSDSQKLLRMELCRVEAYLYLHALGIRSDEARRKREQLLKKLVP
jgi:hypothetical protein